MIKIVVDLLGADKPLSELIKGPIDAINENSDLFVYLSGPQSEIEKELVNYTYNKAQLEIIDAPDAVTNYDKPISVYKTKPESSLIKGLKKACEDDVGGFVSCGSTGGVLVSSIMVLGRVGRCRPALASLMPTINGSNVCILDCGANVDCKQEHLEGFAYMGSAYQKAMGIDNPRVGLLSNGAEDKKGNELVKSTNALLKTLDINFIGNVEGNALLSGNVDVVVCDGFDGNVVIKTLEGTAKALFADLVSIAKKTEDENQRNAILGSIKKLLNKYDYNSKGGAVLLGVNKPVVKGHGAANSETVYSIINMAYSLAKNNLVSKIEENMKNPEK